MVSLHLKNELAVVEPLAGHRFETVRFLWQRIRKNVHKWNDNLKPGRQCEYSILNEFAVKPVIAHFCDCSAYRALVEAILGANHHSHNRCTNFLLHREMIVTGKTLLAIGLVNLLESR